MALDYPLASLEHVLDLAETIDKLGGSCSTEAYLEDSGRKKGGGFTSIVSAANKFGLAVSNKGTLQTTDLFDQLRLATGRKEKNKTLQSAVLNVPLFEEIYGQYKKTTLPEKKTLEKELEKTFDVKRNHASRVAGYCEKAFSEANLLNSDRTFNSLKEKDILASEGQEEKQKGDEKNPLPEREEKFFQSDRKKYSVTFFGPDMDATYEISEEEDFTIIEAILAKIKKKLD